MKKILYVITKANWGGAQRYVFELACAAAEEGHTVAVAYGLPAQTGSSGELGTRLHTAGIRTIALNTLQRDVHFFDEVRSFFALMQTLRREKPDVLHLNSSKASALGALAGRLTRVPTIIFTAHGWAFNEDRSALQKFSIKWIAWLTIILSHKTIAVSLALKNQIAYLPFVSKKITVIPNGSPAINFLSREEARAALAAHIQEGFWMGTVAELHPIKGLRYAIEAFKTVHEKHPHARYFILGEGEERKKLEKQIKDLGLGTSVFLLGHVSEAPRYEKAFDLFLLPSLSESFSIALIEAGFAGLPVVATKVGGIPEIIENESDGLLVPSKNAPAITEALEKLISHPHERQKLGDNLRKKVSEKFTLEKMIEKTFALY